MPILESGAFLLNSDIAADAQGAANILDAMKRLSAGSPDHVAAIKKQETEVAYRRSLLQLIGDQNDR